MWGKLIATFAMLTGVLVLALPISVIGSNFTDAYAASLKARAYHELLEAPSGGGGGAPPPNDVFAHALLREEGARQGAEKARAKLGRERALV